jgi:hypothetical protein
VKWFPEDGLAIVSGGVKTMTRTALLVNCVLVLLYGFFGFVSVAHAYLDPGTGSFMLQMLLAGILGALLYIKLAWHNVKSFFQRRFSRGIETANQIQGPVK